MVLSKREKLSIYLMAVVVFIYLLYAYGLSPTLRQWRSTQQELLIKEARLANEEALLKNKARLEKDYSKLGSLLGSEKEIPDLLRELSKVAKVSGVRITRVRQSSYKGEGSSKEVPLEINLEGDMNDLARFLHGLENSAYLLGVDSLRMRPKQENPMNLDIHLVLSVKSFELEGG